MQAKDIIMQVSEETAGVMEELSDQFLEESTAHFNEIMKAINDIDNKFENLSTKFSGFIGDSSRQIMSNQTEITNKFSSVFDVIEKCRTDIERRATQTTQKTEHLITIMDNVPKLIHAIEHNISESAEAGKEFNSTLFQVMKDLQSNDENFLKIGREHSNIIDELGKQSKENFSSILEKIDGIEICFDTLSHSMQAIIEKQNELYEKQMELDKNIKYLKLPLFKRWFSKG